MTGMMELVKARAATAVAKSSDEYRRVVEEEEELDEAEWGRRTEARSRGRRRAERYVFTCALFASLNAILLGYDSVWWKKKSDDGNGEGDRRTATVLTMGMM